VSKKRILDGSVNGGARRVWIACAGAFVALLLSTAGASAAEPSFDARGSVEQVYATGLTPGASVTLSDGSAQVVETRTANDLGGTLFREVEPGGGYTISSGGETSEPITVLTKASAPPDTSLYDQSIPESGYGYLTTRDGTELAIYVHPPSDVTKVLPGGFEPPTIPAGPTPTLIEYSGYGYADPAGPQSGISIIANLMGFTVVDVNMRGTGCSGGAFDFFEPLQSLDGYDVVETIANQPWVLHNEVGMMGISYGGISQLFTAQTQPPNLSAIAPFSVIDATQTTLYPGGILNTGFAVEWAKERVHDAEPASEGHGQAWANKRIQEGDQACADNQALHPEAADLIKKIDENDHYVPEVADPLAPVTFVDKIEVPTFMACQWTDEQTGGHCPTLASRLTGTDKKWLTFTNGTHVDSLAPVTFNRWYDFLQLYVAKRPPILASAVIQAAAPLIYEEAMGIQGVTLPPDPVQAQPTYDLALAAFEEIKPITVLFDNGAGGKSPGQPYPGFEASFDQFPIPGTEARSLYFGPGGSLGDAPPPILQADGFSWDDEALPPTDFTGNTAAGEGGLWTATPDYEWEQSPSGSAVSYLSPPLTEDTAVIGAGAVDAWVRSSAPDADLQATISEVRPDGKETFVQNGWVTGRATKLDDAKSTPLEPVLSLRESDFSTLPADSFTEVTIPLYYEGHAYRAGSRIRVTIAAPGGTQPIWAFAEAHPQQGGSEIAIAHGPDMPSHLLLPVVPGVEAPTSLPPCPGLRGQPCRDYVPFVNRSADPLSPPDEEGEPPKEEGGGQGPPPGGQPGEGGQPGQSGGPGQNGGSSGNSPNGGTPKKKRVRKCRKQRGKRGHGQSRDRRKARCHRKRHRHPRG
jgi:predicted acyl esterase